MSWQSSYALPEQWDGPGHSLGPDPELWWKLRVAGLLESALTRPLPLETYEPEAGIGRLSAALGWGLVKNNAFVDGNKRIALAAMITFLRLNEHRLTCSEVAETALLLRAAAGEISEAEWTD